jgi:hypothetical protein
VAPRSEVLGDETIWGEETLGVPWGFKPLHPPLPLAGGLMGILRAVVEVAVLAVLHFVRGVTVTYEAIRKWCRKFGQQYANQLRRRSEGCRYEGSVLLTRGAAFVGRLCHTVLPLCRLVDKLTMPLRDAFQSSRSSDSSAQRLPPIHLDLN